MKNRPFILLGLAIVVALATSILIYGWLQRETEVKEVISLDVIPVGVAVVDLSWGKKLIAEEIEMVDFLKGSLQSGYFSDPSELEGRVLIYPVRAGEPIFESRLAPISVQTGGVAAVISPKKRALAVKVDKVIGIAGFIQPGNRVDVLVTIESGKSSESVTKMVLENILVLATGSEMEKTDEEGKATLVDVITLEVTPEEGEKLALATTEGRIQLALRNYTDTDEFLTEGITIPKLLKSYSKKSPKIAKGKVVKRKKQVVVDFIKGDQTSKLKF